MSDIIEGVRRIIASGIIVLVEKIKKLFPKKKHHHDPHGHH